MLQIRAFKNHPAPRCGIDMLIEDITNNSYSLAEPIIMKEIDSDAAYSPLEPTLNLSILSAQKLMDDLWDCGLRPSEGSGSAGQLAATQKHLADMRQLVFAKHKIIGEQK